MALVYGLSFHLFWSKLSLCQQKRHWQYCPCSGSSLLDYANTLVMLGNFSYLCGRLLTFSKIDFFKKFFQKHHQRITPFGSRSGPTFYLSWSGFKLFAKVSRRQNMLLARNEFRIKIAQAGSFDFVKLVLIFCAKKSVCCGLDQHINFE